MSAPEYHLSSTSAAGAGCLSRGRGRRRCPGSSRRGWDHGAVSPAAGPEQTPPAAPEPSANPTRTPDAGRGADLPASRATPVLDDTPLLPSRSADDSDTGWGEGPDSNDDRLLRDVPPHW